jgi:hypothetical protein
MGWPTSSLTPPRADDQVARALASARRPPAPEPSVDVSIEFVSLPLGKSYDGRTARPRARALYRERESPRRAVTDTAPPPEQTRSRRRRRGHYRGDMEAGAALGLGWRLLLAKTGDAAAAACLRTCTDLVPAARALLSARKTPGSDDPLVAIAMARRDPAGRQKRSRARGSRTLEMGNGRSRAAPLAFTR